MGLKYISLQHAFFFWESIKLEKFFIDFDNEMQDALIWKHYRLYGEKIVFI